MNIHYCAPVIYCKLFFLIFDVIFSIAKGVQHDGRLPFWKPASVFAHYIRIVIVFAIGEINILLIQTAKDILKFLPWPGSPPF